MVSLHRDGRSPREDVKAREGTNAHPDAHPGLAGWERVCCRRPTRRNGLAPTATIAPGYCLAGRRSRILPGQQLLIPRPKKNEAAPSRYLAGRPSAGKGPSI
jgi:hypothetical protein